MCYSFILLTLIKSQDCDIFPADKTRTNPFLLICSFKAAMRTFFVHIYLCNVHQTGGERVSMCNIHSSGCLDALSPEVSLRVMCSEWYVVWRHLLCVSGE